MDFKALLFYHNKKQFLNDTYPSLFNTFGQHNNGIYIFLPNHPPKIFQSIGQRSLGGNKIFLGMVALKTENT
jgi:hypothetical protein